MGIVLKQDGVGWHRPFFQTSITKGDRNSVLIDMGRTLTPMSEWCLQKKCRAGFGHGGLGGVTSKEGLRGIHWPYKYSKEAVDENDNGIVLDLKLKEKKTLRFQNGVANAVNRVIDRLGLGDVELTNFYSETGCLFNNWRGEFKWENYLQNRARTTRFIRASQMFSSQSSKPMQEVEQTYADNHGWTINERLNDIYRTERKTRRTCHQGCRGRGQFLEEMPARDLPDDGDIKHSILRTEFELIPDSEGSSNIR